MPRLCSSGVRVSSSPPSTSVGTGEEAVPAGSGGALGTAGQPTHCPRRPLVPTTVLGENGAKGARPRRLSSAVAWRSRAGAGGCEVSQGSADSLHVVARNSGNDTSDSVTAALLWARARRSSGAGSPRRAEVAAAGSWPRRMGSRSPSTSAPNSVACDARARLALPLGVYTRPRSGRLASLAARRATARAPPGLSASSTRGWAAGASRPNGSLPVRGLGESMIWRATASGWRRTYSPATRAP